MNESRPFAKPTRQAPVAVIFLLGDTFRLLVKQLWVIILVVLFNPKRNIFDGFTLVFFGLAVAGSIGSALSYLRYFFYIRDGQLILEKGILQKTKIIVPLDRIQSVNFKQGVLHQMLDVVEIEIETAGSQKREFHLHALKKNDALELRTYLDGFITPATVHVSNYPEHPSAATDSATDTSTCDAPAKLIYRLLPIDLLKIGVSQNHLRMAGILLVFFIGFFDDLEQALGFDTAKEVEKLLGMQHEIDFAYYILLALPIFLIISFLLTLINTVLKHYNLHFWRTARGFKIESGLFTREEFTVSLRKIQYLQWNSNPLKRLFGLVSVRLPQATSVVAGKKVSGSLPGCSMENLATIRKTYFPEESEQVMEDHGVSSRIIYRQMILRGYLPMALLMAITWSWLNTDIWIWLMWLPFAFLISKKYHLNWLWQISLQGLRVNWGVFSRQTVLLQWYKVQAVTIRQSWFLRRRGLATVDISTAAGAVTIPYIPIEKASQLQDFILFKIETDKRSWM